MGLHAQVKFLSAPVALWCRRSSQLLGVTSVHVCVFRESAGGASGTPPPTFSKVTVRDPASLLPAIESPSDSRVATPPASGANSESALSQSCGRTAREVGLRDAAGTPVRAGPRLAQRARAADGGRGRNKSDAKRTSHSAAVSALKA
eukprot:5814620-Prymnesium_polylepis.2